MNRHRIGKGYYALESSPDETEREDDEQVERAFESAFSVPSERIRVLLTKSDPVVDVDRHVLATRALDLTTAQLIRLKRYAQWRMRSLGRKAAGRTYEDLLSEALTATISGERTWRKGVDLCHHLLGAMRSISSGWRQKREVEVHLESELDEPNERGLSRSLEQAATHLDPERIVAAKEELEKVRKLFAKDAVALEVLELLAMGYTESEIRDQLQLSNKEYGAAVKRIRRTLSLRYGA